MWLFFQVFASFLEYLNFIRFKPMKAVEKLDRYCATQATRRMAWCHLTTTYSYVSSYSQILHAICKLKMQHPARLRRAIELKRRIWRYNRYPTITTFKRSERIERSERSMRSTRSRIEISEWFYIHTSRIFFRNNLNSIVLRYLKKVRSYSGHFLISRPILNDKELLWPI